MSKNHGKASFPHDRTYKKAMSNLEVAKNFLEHALPSSTKALLDLSSLKIQNNSFVDEALKLSMTDILYAVNLQNSPESGYVYLLCEHQSTGDRFMPFRLLQYCCKIVNYHLEQHPKTKILPVVVPVILFNGKEPYTYSTNLLDLFGEQHALVHSVFTQPFGLIDLTCTSDEILVTHSWAGLMEMVLKHAQYRDTLALAEKLSDMIYNLMVEKNAENYVLSMINYILEYTDPQDIERFLLMATKKLSKPKGEKIMYAAEYLRQEGRKMAEAEFVSAAEHLRQEGRKMAEAEFVSAAEHLRQEGRKMAEAEFVSAAEHLRQEGRKMAEAEVISKAEHFREEGRRLAEAEFIADFKNTSERLLQLTEETALHQKAEAYEKLVKNLGDEKTAAKVLEISVAELRKVLAVKKKTLG